jgi:hypothetical protein
MSRWAIAAAVAATVVGFAVIEARQAAPAAGQAARPAVPRMPDGKPDFSGIWQAMTAANWDILDHAASQGPWQMGAAFSPPGGRGIVEGNEIPYKPGMEQKKKQNGQNWLQLDPEVKCYLPGTPRAMYMPYPFEMAQSPQMLFVAFEFATATRLIYLDPNDPNSRAQGPDQPYDTWMGWSHGTWEGDTLVVDVKNFNNKTWFDRAGDYHSNELHVTERFSFLDRNTIQYEATITDPQTFTRPWKVSLPLYRHREKNAQIVEFKCPEFAEDFLYGSVYKNPPK